MSLINPYTCSDRDYELAVESHYNRMFNNYYKYLDSPSDDGNCDEDEEDADEYDE